METEIRYYYSKESKSKIIDYLNSYSELLYKGEFYEITDQYNHPMTEYNFYQESIDGRFRVRKTIGNDTSKCMITWKRRLKDNKKQLIHNEEEIEVSIKPDEYDNLLYLLNNVLHLDLIESYERNRSVFINKEVEIVVDEYPFGICLEIENKCNDKEPENIIKKWLDKLKLDINDAYPLSWDDKYEELCKEQNIKPTKIVRFTNEMPKITVLFEK